MERAGGRDRPRAVSRWRSKPSVASGRALVVAMVVLLVCDVIGGFLAVVAGVATWGEAWGFSAGYPGGVTWGIVLLAVTATVGVLAAARARHLYELR